MQAAHQPPPDAELHTADVIVQRRRLYAQLFGPAPEEAAALIERIRREVHPLEIISEITSPVLGINTGPRALALAGYNE